MENLTKREHDIIKLLVLGKSNHQIAEELFISVHTVKASLERIYDKTGIHSRVLLALSYAKQYNYFL